MPFNQDDQRERAMVTALNLQSVRAGHVTKRMHTLTCKLMARITGCSSNVNHRQRTAISALAATLD
jgi:hypothetical protein